MRGGRVSPLKGLLARVLGLLPVLTISEEGKAEPAAKARGFAAAREKMMTLLFKAADALEAIYPLRINHFQITEGQVTYIDDDTKHPLQITHANFVATNIRNVKSPDHTYPSPIHLNAAVFDRGRLRGAS